MLQPAAGQQHLFLGFERHALATPDAVAVIDDECAWSYRELAARAERIAWHLATIGVAAEQPVAVWMERRAELLAVLLGILKAGGAYVPIDPRDPPDRVQRMLRASGCRVVLGDAALLASLPDGAAAREPAQRAVDLASIPDPPPGAEAPPCAPGGERLAYLLFTSGSTGDPKAVEVEHRHVLVLLRSAVELLRFGPRDRYLAASTIAFDASITELFLPLVTGGSLLLRDRSILLEPRRLARDVRDHGVSVVATGPSVWQVVLNEVPDFPRVRVAITHGEAVAPALAARLGAVGEEVWNLYGPTETTVWATGWRVRAGDPPGLSGASAPIGRPLPHVQAFVVDASGAPVPDGTEGELWLAGPSVARGYRGNEALTRERFVAVGGERAYRSGDVVVRDAAGVLHYFGRNDDQIKVRGVRVEPGEVEAAILRDPHVAQAAATWFPTPGGTRAIVAAVVLRPGAPGKAQELHDGLAGRLPKAMVPARFLFVPWLPTTTSGKIDRQAIRQAATTSSEPAAEPVAAAPPPGRPRTDTERALAEIWQRLLGLEHAAPDDHFFSAGGDSLTAVQMMVEAEAAFGLVLPVHLAFEAPTLEALARRIDDARAREGEEPERAFVYPLVPGGRGHPLFFANIDLKLARRGLWTVPCPLYAISNWAKGVGFVQAGSLPELAARHLEGLQRLQPEGPYRLAGFSLGALVAFEMAQQLRAAGERVELLFLLDPMAPRQVDAPGFSVPPAAPRAPWPARAAGRLRRIARGPGERGWAHWLSLLLPLQRLAIVGWIRYVAVHHYLRRPNPVTRVLFPRNRWRAFWFAAQRMVDAYVARPYDGPALAVFSEEGRRGTIWRALLGADAGLHPIDATHMALFDEPARGRWMAWLREALERGD